jgi:hypothetical protein
MEMIFEYKPVDVPLQSLVTRGLKNKNISLSATFIPNSSTCAREALFPERPLNEEGENEDARKPRIFNNDYSQAKVRY